MQMYLFTEGTFRRSDGDFDFDVIAHELFHGVSNRSAAKGGTGCLGLTMFGESNVMGEGWGDAIGASMTDDDALGEFVTGEQDTAIRRLPQANYRWSYGTVNQNVRFRRDGFTPDANPGSTPFQVHAVGELWSSTVWDMRELLIMKNAGCWMQTEQAIPLQSLPHRLLILSHQHRLILRTLNRQVQIYGLHLL